jgi:hypothetical protein
MVPNYVNFQINHQCWWGGGGRDEKKQKKKTKSFSSPIALPGEEEEE